MDEQTIKRIWDGFGKEGQNMSFGQFRKEMLGLTSQAGIQRDLRDIELQKARHRTNKIRIDRAMEN